MRADERIGVTLPVMHVIADICVTPLGLGPSVSGEVRRAVELLRDAGLETHTHAYGTNVEGEWDDVFAALRRVHEELHAGGVARLSTTIRLGTRTDKSQSIADKIRKATDGGG